MHKFHTLLMVRLGLPVAREEHFGKTSSERSSDDQQLSYASVVPFRQLLADIGM